MDSLVLKIIKTFNGHYQISQVAEFYVLGICFTTPNNNTNPADSILLELADQVLLFSPRRKYLVNLGLLLNEGDRILLFLVRIASFEEPVRVQAAGFVYTYLQKQTNSSEDYFL